MYNEAESRLYGLVFSSTGFSEEEYLSQWSLRQDTFFNNFLKKESFQNFYRFARSKFSQWIDPSIFPEIYLGFETALFEKLAGCFLSTKSQNRSNAALPLDPEIIVPYLAKLYYPTSGKIRTERHCFGQLTIQDAPTPDTFLVGYPDEKSILPEDLLYIKWLGEISVSTRSDYVLTKKINHQWMREYYPDYFGAAQTLFVVPKKSPLVEACKSQGVEVLQTPFDMTALGKFANRVYSEHFPNFASSLQDLQQRADMRHRKKIEVEFTSRGHRQFYSQA